MPKLAVVEVGALPGGWLEDAISGAARALRLEVDPARPHLDPTFAFDAGRGQYLAAALLARLREFSPEAVMVAGITAVDLFLPILTFVFGEAEMPGRAAIFSIHRLREEFYGLPANPGLLADRAAKELLHELGHTRGLTHCPDYSCAMSSSHAVEAVDLKGLRLCERCRRRLEISEGRSFGFL